MTVRRALDATRPRGSGSGPTALSCNISEMLNWGYWVTDHVAQGRTVTGGRAVIAGTEDRQHAYVALSCGTGTNMAYVFTVSPRLADPMPGPRPAPELARIARITAERTVQQTAMATETQHALATLSGYWTERPAAVRVAGPAAGPVQC